MGNSLIMGRSCEKLNKDITCKNIIDEVQRQLKLQQVHVCYDSMNEVANRIRSGAHVVYFSVIDNVAEREKYEKKTDEAKKIYKSKSPVIHFPDLTINEIVEIYRCGVEDEYQRVVSLLVDNNISIKSEVAFVCFLFLHEVGHWNQLYQKNMLVKMYLEDGIEQEKQIFELQNEILNRILRNNDIALLGSDIVISKKDKEKYHELQVKYREIPKEAEADEYAFSMISKLKIKL